MSQPLLLTSLLGAQADAWAELARNLGVNRQDLPWMIAVAVLALVALLGTGIWLTLRTLAARKQLRSNDGMQLFLELCRVHQLDRASRRLLQRLATAHELKHPALLFVEPQRYDSNELDASWQSSHDKLVALRDLLFAHPIVEPQEETLAVVAQ